MVDIRLLGENSPEKAIEDFINLLKESNKKELNCTFDVVSKGTPVVTSQFINSILMKASTNPENLIYMSSDAGQDSGYIPAEEKTMIFIPSKGGSHNPKESTKRIYIEEAIDLMYNGIVKLCKEKNLMKRYIIDKPIKVDSTVLSQADNPQVLEENSK